MAEFHAISVNSTLFVISSCFSSIPSVIRRKSRIPTQTANSNPAREFHIVWRRVVLVMWAVKRAYLARAHKRDKEWPYSAAESMSGQRGSVPMTHSDPQTATGNPLFPQPRDRPVLLRNTGTAHARRALPPPRLALACACSLSLSLSPLAHAPATRPRLRSSAHRPTAHH